MDQGAGKRSRGLKLSNTIRFIDNRKLKQASTAA
jgi:hypothetical protein